MAIARLRAAPCAARPAGGAGHRIAVRDLAHRRLTQYALTNRSRRAAPLRMATRRGRPVSFLPAVDLRGLAQQRQNHDERRRPCGAFRRYIESSTRSAAGRQRETGPAGLSRAGPPGAVRQAAMRTMTAIAGRIAPVIPATATNRRIPSTMAMTSGGGSAVRNSSPRRRYQAFPISMPAPKTSAPPSTT